MTCGRVQPLQTAIPEDGFVSGMIQNLPSSFQYKDVQDLLRPFGIVRLTILKERQGCAIFKCKNKNFFSQLEKKLHGTFLAGCNKALLIKKKDSHSEISFLKKEIPCKNDSHSEISFLKREIPCKNDSFFPKKEIGVYFGSFDPIHENHMALARFALEHCNVQEVVFAPNVNHISKPHMKPLHQRLHLIKTRLLEEENDKVLKHVHVFDTTGKEMHWQGRLDILNAIQKEWAKKDYFADVFIAQLIGQDSFLEPGCQRAIQTSNLDMRMIVFPRLDCKSDFAKEYKTKCIRVEIAKNYRDKISFSSTKAREDLKNNVYPEGLHLSVYCEILAMNMYSRLNM